MQVYQEPGEGEVQARWHSWFPFLPDPVLTGWEPVTVLLVAAFPVIGICVPAESIFRILCCGPTIENVVSTP